MCLKPFLATLIFFDFHRDVGCPRNGHVGGNMVKMVKKRQNTCFFHQNDPDRCQKIVETPFSRVRIISDKKEKLFHVKFWLKKVYKLDFRKIEIFGHSDTISLI